MFCRKCGAKMEENASICQCCGTSFSVSDVTPKDFRQWLRCHPFPVLIFCLAFLFLIPLSFSVFSKPTPATDSLIWAQIDSYYGLSRSGLTLDTFTEVKRDTDFENKYDHIWVDIVASNDTVQFCASYYVYYALYNDGWEFESLQELQSDYHAMERVSDSMLRKDLLEVYDSYISQYDLQNIHITANIPAPNSDTKKQSFTCNVSAENAEMTISASINVTYRLYMTDTQCGWALSAAQLNDVTYAAKDTPSDELVASITSTWGNNFTLISSTQEGANYCTLLFKECDDTSFSGLIVDWEKMLSFKFDPDQGGWLLDSMTQVPIDVSIDVSVNVSGSWNYTSGSNYITLDVSSASMTQIDYDLSFSIRSSNILAVGTRPLSASWSEQTRQWNWEYIGGNEPYIILTATEPLFTFTYNGGLWEEDYNLSYKAYTNTSENTSGFYVNNWCLTLES